MNVGTFDQLLYLQAVKRYNEISEKIFEGLTEKRNEYEQANEEYTILFRNLTKFTLHSFYLKKIKEISIDLNDDVPNAIVKQNPDIVKMLRKPQYYAYMSMDTEFVRNLLNSFNFDKHTLKTIYDYVCSNKRLIQSIIEDLKNTETVTKVNITSSFDLMLTYFDN